MLECQKKSSFDLHWIPPVTRYILSVVLFWCLGWQASWVQVQAAVTGTISGFVRDPSAAAVPGANVTAKMVEQQITRTVQTNSEGYYTFVALPPGTYEITFEANEY